MKNVKPVITEEGEEIKKTHLILFAYSKTPLAGITT